MRSLVRTATGACPVSSSICLHPIPWDTTTEACSITVMPWAVARGDAAGPCVRARSLIDHEGVKELPMLDLPPLKVVAMYRGNPPRLIRQLLDAIAAAARELAATAAYALPPEKRG